MNNRGNVILNLMFFLMALGVLIAFIGPINSFLGMAQQSDGLNCYGYTVNGDATNSLSFNATLNGGNSGSPLACLAIKLYLPYIFLVFLIGGIMAVLGNKGIDLIGGGQQSEPQY